MRTQRMITASLVVLAVFLGAGCGECPEVGTEGHLRSGEFTSQPKGFQEGTGKAPTPYDRAGLLTMEVDKEDNLVTVRYTLADGRNIVERWQMDPQSSVKNQYPF